MKFRLFKSRSQPSAANKPERIKLDDFDRDLIPLPLQEIHKELREAGHRSYLVGGCVRDYLLGLTPKDFDSATDARPKRIISVIHRARIIGRRFLLVHARRGRWTFELATFRKAPRTGSDEPDTFAEENTYGNHAQDASRRDFTINALYFDLRTHEVIDYVDGLQDLRDKRLRSVGPADIRFQEDPVRIIRAIRFSAKCDFTIDQEIQQAISDHRQLLGEVSGARLRDELTKLFLTGHGLQSYQLMLDFDLMSYVYPHDPEGIELIEQAMLESDERYHAGEKLSPAYLFGVMLWNRYADYVAECQSEQEDRSNLHIFRQQAFSHVMRLANANININREAQKFIFGIFQLQARLENKKNVKRTLDHQYIRAAIHLLVIRSKVGEVSPSLAAWWLKRQPPRRPKPTGQRGRRSRRAPRRYRHRREAQ